MSRNITHMPNGSASFGLQSLLSRGIYLRREPCASNSCRAPFKESLEQLKVLTPASVTLDNALHTVDIRFTPTIPHCSMATLIGLCIRVKLIRSLPTRFKVTVSITPGTHASEKAVNKQLNDKERVAAALENAHLLGVVNKCIAHTDPISDAASPA